MAIELVLNILVVLSAVIGLAAPRASLLSALTITVTTLAWAGLSLADNDERTATNVIYVVGFLLLAWATSSAWRKYHARKTLTTPADSAVAP